MLCQRDSHTRITRRMRREESETHTHTDRHRPSTWPAVSLGPMLQIGSAPLGQSSIQADPYILATPKGKSIYIIDFIANIAIEGADSLSLQKCPLPIS